MFCIEELTRNEELHVTDRRGATEHHSDGCERRARVENGDGQEEMVESTHGCVESDNACVDSSQFIFRCCSDCFRVCVTLKHLRSLKTIAT